MHGRSSRSATVTFRVHFSDGDVIDVVATNPNSARDIARKIKDGGIVSKVKVLKGT